MTKTHAFEEGLGVDYFSAAKEDRNLGYLSWSVIFYLTPQAAVI